MEDSKSPWRGVPMAAAAAVFTLVFFLFAAGAPLKAQAADPAAVPLLNLQLASQDRSAAALKSNFFYHAIPAQTAAAKITPRALLTAGAHAATTVIAPPVSSAATPAIPVVPAPGFYPSDLVYFGGVVIGNTKSHALLVNCNLGCFGNPLSFLADLGNSDFIHITDQYVGTNLNSRYRIGAGASFTAPLSGHLLKQAEIIALVHAAASHLGAGYGHIYHVLLAPGIDTCFDGTPVCYSPDNLATFAFCAYHSSVDFDDIGHVLFTVVPFQRVDGCSVPSPSPNGQLADSTDSTLSHELIEAITDPDGDGWFAALSLDTLFFEIADLCQPVLAGFSSFPLSRHNYELQLEYSNRFHGCANVP